MTIINSQNFFSVIEPLLPKNPLIIEAGAFKGTDTIRLINYWPNATIHAFEPVPEIYNALTLATQHHSRIHRYQLALSNHTGIQLFYNAQHPKRPEKLCQAGSLLKPKDRLSHSPIIYPTTSYVNTITLDDWAAHYNVSSADFIWLDLQGHELAVLQSSSHLLATVTLLYLEVNFIEAYENQASYSETELWLQSQGFEPIAQDFTDTKQWFFGNKIYLNSKISI